MRKSIRKIIKGIFRTKIIKSIFFIGCRHLYQYTPPVSREVLDLLAKKTTSAPFIMTLCTYNYRANTLRWANSLRHLNHSSFFIVALDQKTYDFFQAKGMQVFILTIPWRILIFSFRLWYPCYLWVLRMYILKTLINHGINLIHSDSDVIWHKDAISDYLTDFRHFDLLSSQGLNHPAHIFNQMGTTLCCGFFYLKSSPASRRFWDELIKFMSSMVISDEQIGLNRFVYMKQKQTGAKIIYDNSQREITVIDIPDIRLGLLPKSKFPRIKEHIINMDDVYLTHFDSNKIKG